MFCKNTHPDNDLVFELDKSYAVKPGETVELADSLKPWMDTRGLFTWLEVVVKDDPPPKPAKKPAAEK